MQIFNSKKVMCIHQEIYAHLIMYNFAEMITPHIVIEKKQRKYTYKANFSIAAHMCRLFYRGKATSPNLETIIARHIIPSKMIDIVKEILRSKSFMVSYIEQHKFTKMESFFRQMQICLISMLKNAKWQESTKLSYHLFLSQLLYNVNLMTLPCCALLSLIQYIVSQITGLIRRQVRYLIF